LFVDDCTEDCEVGGLSVVGPNDDDDGLNGDSLGIEVPPIEPNSFFSVCLNGIGSLGRALDSEGPLPNGLNGCLGGGELPVNGFVIDFGDPNGDTGCLGVTLDIVAEDDDDG
jgi:hypothetical protein